MEFTSPMLVVSGILCVALALFVLRKAAPRDGKTSALASTDFRAGAMAIALLGLCITGVALLVKGLMTAA